jgi:hypothetical protein
MVHVEEDSIWFQVLEQLEARPWHTLKEFVDVLQVAVPKFYISLFAATDQTTIM